MSASSNVEDVQTLSVPGEASGVGRPTIEALRTMMASVLDHTEFSIDDTLQRSGVDSLNQFRLLLLVEEEFGVRIAPQSVGKSRTLRELASLIDDRRAKRAAATVTSTDLPEIIQLPGEGRKPPVFFVHPAAGSGYAYYRLAELMQLDRSSYGLHAPAYTAADDGITIESIASRYLEAILQQLPSLESSQGRGGTLQAVFAGFSFGGLVAYEMARQLEQSGRTQVPVLIIDVGPKQPHRPIGQLFADVTGNFPQWLKHDAMQTSAGDLFRRALRPFRKRSSSTPSAATQHLFNGQHRAPTVHAAATRVLEKAVRLYAPGPYQGKTVLLRAMAPMLFSPRDPSMGWAALAADLTIGRLPGSHGSCLEGDNLPQSAAVVKEHLSSMS